MLFLPENPAAALLTETSLNQLAIIAIITPKSVKTEMHRDPSSYKRFFQQL